MIRRHPRAIDAIIELSEYIGQDSTDAAERFIAATEETFNALERMPGMGHRYESRLPRLQELRVWAVKGFPNHLIFYRPIADGIEVLTLLPGARDIPNVLPDEI